MTTLVIFEGKTKEDSIAVLKDFLRKHIPDTRSYMGCQNIEAYLNKGEKSLVMIEHWNSEECYENYLDWRERTGVLSELDELLDTPPIIRFFDILDT